MRKSILLFAAGAALVLPQSSRAMNIVLNPNAALMANPAALTAFQNAANTWDSLFSDPITVNIDANLTSLLPGVLGTTTNTVYQTDFSFDTVRNAIAADALDEPNDAIVATLPTSLTVSANVPNGKTFDNQHIAISRANLKAIGLTPPTNVTDASITFTTNLPFDYDDTDGVSSGTYDFQAVATHEIGHALGFFSNVDVFDATSATSTDLSTLDLFRFAGTGVVNAATFANGARELEPGFASVTSDTSVAYQMSTGRFKGDGNQASHWKDDGTPDGGPFTSSYIGIMDPTLGTGLTPTITAADLRAFDLIGYDLVAPEPASLAMVGLGGLMLVRRRRA